MRIGTILPHHFRLCLENASTRYLSSSSGTGFRLVSGSQTVLLDLLVARSKEMVNTRDELDPDYLILLVAD